MEMISYLRMSMYRNVITFISTLHQISVTVWRDLFWRVKYNDIK